MPRLTFLPALMLVGLALVPAGCSQGAERHGTESNSTAPQDWGSLKNFTGIDATGPDDVIITIGSGFSVKAEGDPKVLQRLDIRVDGDTLEIGRKKRFGLGWSEGNGATIRVTLPRLDDISLTGSGDVEVDKAEGASLEAELTGSGNLKVGAAKVGTLDAEITGSGDLSMGGTAETAEVSVTGSGNFAGKGLHVGRAKVSILGSGNSDFASDGPVDISIMGSGNVTVKGRAQCKSSVMGSGEARCAP